MDTLEQSRVLFSRISKGDEAAFRETFHHYNAKLFPRILRMVKSKPEAEEIIQEIFLRVWLKKNSLQAIENPGAWLYTIASHLCLDALRKQVANRLKDLELKDKTTDANPGPHDHLQLKEIQSLVDEALNHLPPSRKQIFILSRTEGLSRAEIAGQMKLSESTVKNQLTAALRFVSEYIGQHGYCYLPPFFILLVS